MLVIFACVPMESDSSVPAYHHSGTARIMPSVRPTKVRHKVSAAKEAQKY